MELILIQRKQALLATLVAFSQDVRMETEISAFLALTQGARIAISHLLQVSWGNAFVVG